ncbi:hypothetical protein M2168_006299 [Streptomyces sp. CZ24]|nr:hypothetical protein [Streptomyces sp. CZ24]
MISNCSPLRGAPLRVRGRQQRRIDHLPDLRSIPAGAGPSRILGSVVRSIPAGAGPTQRGVLETFVQAEHPRGCGADWRRSGPVCPGGASPRVRGRLGGEAVGTAVERSIPAGAGPTAGSGHDGDLHWEHPRGCGADTHMPLWPLPWSGASPRVRGRRGGVAVVGAEPRSIPAGAGPTRRPGGRGAGRAEHPRGCGADRLRSTMPGAARGASPRVRGRPLWITEPTLRARSIPAGAGPTVLRVVMHRCGEEHPRGCGADLVDGEPVQPCRGASPRVRGRPREHRPDRRSRRSIPAGAGPTPSGTRRSPTSGEHPRGCGADTC